MTLVRILSWNYRVWLKTWIYIPLCFSQWKTCQTTMFLSQDLSYFRRSSTKTVIIHLCFTCKVVWMNARLFFTEYFILKIILQLQGLITRDEFKLLPRNYSHLHSLSNLNKVSLSSMQLKFKTRNFKSNLDCLNLKKRPKICFLNLIRL